jgi:anti-anti-sigma factor
MAEGESASRPVRYGSATLAIADEGARLVVSVAGEIDLANSGEIFAALSKGVTAEHEEIALDLSETTYVDSAGIALLIDVNGRLNTRRTRLVVIAPPGSAAARLLSLSGVDKVLEVEAG